LGEHSTLLESSSLDIVFSVSVVEHVPDLGPFFEDGLRILKPGGLWLHAIDCYVEDKPTDYWNGRFEAYRNWLKHPQLEPVGPIFEGPLKFTCDMATNPDDVMHSWGKISPSLIELRKRAQSVSIILAARRK